MNYIVKAQVEKKNGRMVAIASTSVEDRHGEKVHVDGWDLKNFKKNAVLLWGHDHYTPAIGNAKNIKVEGVGKKAQLVFEPVFHDRTPEAAAIKALYEGWEDAEGAHDPVLNSFSVGFRPLEAEGADYLKQELLEISAVNVPANPEARMMSTKNLTNKGFDKKIIKSVIDNEIESPEDVIKNLEKRNAELESEVKVLRSQSSKSYEAEQRMKRLKAIDRLTEQLLVDTKKELHNGTL